MLTSHVIVHQYNPFENVYKKELFSPQLEIFPDKLQNLHGYRLTAGISIENANKYRLTIPHFLPSNEKMGPRNMIANELSKEHPSALSLTVRTLL